MSAKTFKCQWNNCSNSEESFNSLEDLVHHVMDQHIPTIVQNEDGDKEVQCHWKTCRTTKSHGELKEWMKNHFMSKHAKTAKMFKCAVDGCNVRKATQLELDSHVKTGHKEKKEKPAPKPKPVKKIRYDSESDPETDIEEPLKEDEEWTDPEYEDTRSLNEDGSLFIYFYYTSHNVNPEHYRQIKCEAKRISKKKGQKLTKSQKKAKREAITKKMEKRLFEKLTKKVEEFEKDKDNYQWNYVKNNEYRFIREYTAKMAGKPIMRKRKAPKEIDTAAIKYQRYGVPPFLNIYR